MPTPPEWGPVELAGLAADYLALLDSTQDSAGHPADHSRTAPERAMIRDQILAALGLTRDDPFDVITWARATVAATGRQDPPFPTNQPLERYRLHHAMRLAEFTAFLGITQAEYLALIAGDAERAATLGQQVARRLHTSPWLITEIAPGPDEEELDEILASIEEGEEQGYWRVDAVSGEMEGPVLLERKAARPSVPHEHLQLAGALARLIAIHPAGEDQDYPALRGYLESRIRSVLGVGPGERFDIEPWADDILEGSISLLRGRGPQG